MRLISLDPAVEFDLPQLFESLRRSAPAADAAPALVLGRQRKRCDIRVPVTAGNVDTPNADLSEAEKTATMNVSRVHAKIFETDQGYRIEDMKTLNGMFVNGRKTAGADLNPGDQLVIGLGANISLGGRLAGTPLPALCLLVAGPAKAAAKMPMAAAAAENAAPSLAAAAATGPAHDASREPLAALSQSDCIDSQRASQSQSQTQHSSEPADASSTGSCPPAAVPAAEPQGAVLAAGVGAVAAAVKEELIAAEPPKPKGREKAKVRQSRMLRELEFSSPGPGMISAKALADVDAAAAARAEVQPTAVAGFAPAAAEWANDADVTEELQCAICRYILVEPHSILCSHSFCGPCLHGWLTSCRKTALTTSGKAVRKRKRQRSTKPGNDDDEKGVELPCPVCRTSIISKPILVRSLRAAVEAVSAATQATHAARASAPGRAPGDEAAAKAAAADLLAVQNELADRAERRSEWATLRKAKPVRLTLNEDGEIVPQTDGAEREISPPTRAGRAAAAKAAAAVFDPFDSFEFGDSQHRTRVGGNGGMTAAGGRQRRRRQPVDESTDEDDGSESEDLFEDDESSPQEVPAEQEVVEVKEEARRPSKVQKRSSPKRHPSDTAADHQDAADALTQQPSLHAFFGATTRDAAAADAHSAAAADAARSAAEVASAAAAEEEDSGGGPVGGSMEAEAAGDESDFDVGADSLFD